ncbi:MAG: DUF116 domain-containing protein [Anaerolineae bacterium]
MSNARDDLARRPPGERVLLLSHCLRPSRTCPGKPGRRGLVCPDGCAEDCVLGRLRKRALELGYAGVCIAAGGAMALRFVAEMRPRAIVAIACHKELAEGIEAVAAMSKGKAPPIVAVPLATDGCIDTQVDEEDALAAINLGCLPRASRRPALSAVG